MRITTNLKLTLLFIFVFHTFLSSQNVGVNAPNPSAKLHVAGEVITEEPINAGFENGNLLPGINLGDVDWFVTATDGYNSMSSAKCPFIFDNGDKAILQFIYPSPLDKHVTLEFYFKYDDPNNTSSFGITMNGTDYFPPQTSNSWKLFTITSIGTGNGDKLEFTVVADQAEANPLIVIDDIRIVYEDGHAFKLTDGNQAEGYILETDDLGHGKWVDLRSEIDQTILDAAQDLHFNTTTYDLSIDNGNMVSISGLETLNGERFGIEGLTLEGSPGLSIDLPNSNASTSRFYYNSTNGQFIRGRYSFTPTPGDFATSWGRNNKANANYSTTFGEENEAYGLRSTAWGTLNTSNGHSSTTWGINNSTDGYASTTWGLDNNTTGSYATTFGRGNANTGNFGTALGWSNISTGEYNLVGGYDNVASGDYNFILGEGCETTADHEVALGKFNISSNGGTQANLFSIGSGTGPSSRKNAMTVLQNGNIGFGVDLPTVDFHIKSDVLHTNVLVESSSGQNAILDINGDYLAELNINATNFESKLNMTGPGAFLSLEGQNSSVIFFGPNKDESIRYNHTSDNVEVFGNIWVDGGNVGIRESNPSYRLEVGQNSAAKPGSSSWTVSSDRRLKKDVQPFREGIETIKAINPVWFTYNGLAGIPESRHVGTIAQELEAIAPYMVGSFTHKSEDGDSTVYKDVDYGAMDFVLINAIKDQQAIIEAQNATIATLKSQLSIQENQIDQIVKRLEDHK